MEEILNVLQNIFQKCDENGSGVVETNKLIDQLTSQNTVWQDDKLIKEEFNKLLKVNETNETHYISKQDFINSLLQWFQEYCEKQVSDNIVDLSGGHEDQDESPASSTGGIRESSSETNSKSSASSIEENFLTIYYVPEGSRLSREEHVPEDSSMSESDSPVSNERTRILESELSLLKQRNEFLETANSTLLSQVSCLEDDISKYKKELDVFVERLSLSNDTVKAHEFKLEESEEKLLNNSEENKSKTIKLARLKYENSKLKGSIIRLEKNNDNLTHGKLIQSSKVHELQARIESLSERHNIIMKEIDDLRSKELECNEFLNKLAGENDNLKSQLESRDLLIQELTLEQTSIKRELCKQQNSKVQIEPIDCELASDLSADNSMVFSNASFLKDSNIPFETSLFAELHDKVNPFKNTCECSKSTSSSSVSTMTDHYIYNVESDQRALLDSITKDFGSRTPPPVCKDAAVDCSIKNWDNDDATGNGNICKSNHQYTRWSVAKSFIRLIFIMALLLTVLALGFFSWFPATGKSKSPQCSTHCLLSFLEILGIYERTRLEVVM